MLHASNSQGWYNTEAPCLSSSSSSTWLGSSQVGCPQRSRYDPLSPGLQLHPDHQPKRFLSNTVTSDHFHQWPEREERLAANHPTRSFKTQQIPHQGGEQVLSLTGHPIYLFKGYPSSEQGRIPSPCRSVLPNSSGLQQDSQTFLASLHPQMLASLFNTSQQTARSFIPQCHNLNMGNKFTFSLKTLLWV